MPSSPFVDVRIATNLAAFRRAFHAVATAALRTNVAINAMRLAMTGVPRWAVAEYRHRALRRIGRANQRAVQLQESPARTSMHAAYHARHRRRSR